MKEKSQDLKETFFTLNLAAFPHAIGPKMQRGAVTISHTRLRLRLMLQGTYLPVDVLLTSAPSIMNSAMAFF